MLASIGALFPKFHVRCLAQHGADSIHVSFSLLKQAVEADRRIVVSAGAKRSKAKRNVEARLAHRAVAFVIIGAETDNALWFAGLPSHGPSGVANRYVIVRAVWSQSDINRSVLLLSRSRR